jgi:hypothetical protein
MAQHKTDPSSTAGNFKSTKLNRAKVKSKNDLILSKRNVLYVVLHGLVCLIDDNRKHFTADLVDMGEDHAYLCGDFLAEEPIVNGSELTLLGIDPANISSKNQLDPQKNVAVKLTDIPYSNNYYYCRLNLPRPVDITYYINGTLNSADLPDLYKELQDTPKQIAGIRVFEYTMISPNDVRLQDNDSGEIFWQCQPQYLATTKNLNVAVLHVFNEPAETLDGAAKHNKDEFNFTLSYMDARLRMVQPAIVQDNDLPPEGIRMEELYALDRRDELVQKLMKSLREGTTLSSFTASSLKSVSVFGGGGAGGSQVCGGANGIILP